MGLLPAMFCLGAFATMAQVLFVREMLVAFFGNELTIGLIFAGWFLGIASGAFSARLALARFSRRPDAKESGCAAIITLLATVLVGAGISLPLQVAAIRTVRVLFGVGLGEYAPFGAIAASSFLIPLPSSWSVGMLFPCACHVLSVRRGEPDRLPARIVSAIYAAESLGSMVGGAALTFVLLRVLAPVGIVAVSCGIALAGAALVCGGRAVRVGLGLGATALFIAGVCPQSLTGVDRWAAELRWRAFGVLSSSGDGAGPVRLEASSDSVYQNLAVTESAGQRTLWANGQVMFVFPDPMSYELQTHFIMAQLPSARRVLVIGGNPVGELPELLDYPLERLVYVEADELVGGMARRFAQEEYDSVFADARVERVTEDPPRFVSRRRDRFDAILVDAPQPNTAACNRYYTADFFQNARRLLAPGGFVYTRVQSSELLHGETVDIGASVYKTLLEVFPVVLATAGDWKQFFAGEPDSNLTFDREELYRRSKASGVSWRHFRPEYFLAADEISPAKTEFVKNRLLAADVPINTNLRPITYFYNLVLWGRLSGSWVGSSLKVVGGLRLRDVVWFVLLVSTAVGIAGAAFRLGDRSGRLSGDAWARRMVGASLALTGLSGMAIEVLLVFVFQNLYGYVYTRIGLIVAVFMMGLALGAPSGRLLAVGAVRRAWARMAELVVVLILAPLALPAIVEMTGMPSPGLLPPAWIEALIYLLVALVGWVVGCQFPIANRLWCEAGGTISAAAAATDASDHLGAALGSLVVGVFLVPVMGIGGSCVAVALLNGLSLCCLASGFAAGAGR